MTSNLWHKTKVFGFLATQNGINGGELQTWMSSLRISLDLAETSMFSASESAFWQVWTCHCITVLLRLLISLQDVEVSSISACRGSHTTTTEKEEAEHTLWMQSWHAQDAAARRYVQLSSPAILYKTWVAIGLQPYATKLHQPYACSTRMAGLYWLVRASAQPVLPQCHRLIAARYTGPACEGRDRGDVIRVSPHPASTRPARSRCKTVEYYLHTP